jgi:hypothetical protein
VDKTLKPVRHLFKVARCYAFLVLDRQFCFWHCEYGNFCDGCMYRMEKRNERRMKKIMKRAPKARACMRYLLDDDILDP